MRIYEVRMFVLTKILDKNFKWTKRWYLDHTYTFARKSDMFQALKGTLRMDTLKSLRNRYKYTIKCIYKKGGAKRV